MLDIEKYEFLVLGIKSLILLGIISLIPKIVSCYKQAFTFKLELIGIDFLQENESITIKSVNAHILIVGSTMNLCHWDEICICGRMLVSLSNVS